MREHFDRDSEVDMTSIFIEAEVIAVEDGGSEAGFDDDGAFIDAQVLLQLETGSSPRLFRTILDVFDHVVNVVGERLLLVFVVDERVMHEGDEWDGTTPRVPSLCERYVLLLLLLVVVAEEDANSAAVSGLHKRFLWVGKIANLYLVDIVEVGSPCLVNCEVDEVEFDDDERILR